MQHKLKHAGYKEEEEFWKMNTADHSLLKCNYKNKEMMSTGASSSVLKCGVRVMIKMNTKDYDVGHCSNCIVQVKASEFTTKRSDLSMDSSLAQKKGSQTYDREISAHLVSSYVANISGYCTWDSSF